MLYDPAAIAAYFDDLALGEWERFSRTPTEEVKLAIHTHYLNHHVPHGSRVLEIGAGPGRFTQMLASRGCSVVVTDLSPVQLDLNRRHAREHSFDEAVEEWLPLDVCNMSRFPDESFDVVIAYGGPLSYVLDARTIALRECCRVTKGEGLVLLSVMSLWGTMHAYLPGCLDLPQELNQEIIRSGDLTATTNPGSRHHCHMFRSSELRELLEDQGLVVVELAASNSLATDWNERLVDIRQAPEKWGELLELEILASNEQGCIDMGTHIIAAARKLMRASST